MTIAGYNIYAVTQIHLLRSLDYACVWGTSLYIGALFNILMGGLVIQYNG